MATDFGRGIIFQFGSRNRTFLQVSLNGLLWDCLVYELSNCLIELFICQWHLVALANIMI